MIKVYTNTKIYIAAPAAAATGGPELLHQLAYNLRNDLDIEAYMYYYPNNHPKPVHPNYEEYGIPFVNHIEDSRGNILIVPEVIEGVYLLEYYHNIRKVIWWLSVDNFYRSKYLSNKINLFGYRIINKIYRKLTKKDFFDISKLVENKYINKYYAKEDPMCKQANYHLVQSSYALDHLLKAGFDKDKIFYLSDYLNLDFLKTQTDLSKKENIVAYNPKKGLVFTKKIISLAKDIKFVPLVNMSREEVIKTLQRAKVYIDFGNHPGKDRIPREAAILGCCVITGKRGSAAFFEDVPIPDEYKFEDKKENIPKIIEKIKDCFENFEKRYKDFDYYRQTIQNEPQKFIEDLTKIFVKVQD